MERAREREHESAREATERAMERARKRARERDGAGGQHDKGLPPPPITYLGVPRAGATARGCAPARSTVSPSSIHSIRRPWHRTPRTAARSARQRAGCGNRSPAGCRRSRSRGSPGWLGPCNLERGREAHKKGGQDGGLACEEKWLGSRPAHSDTPLVVTFPAFGTRA